MTDRQPEAAPLDLAALRRLAVDAMPDPWTVRLQPATLLALLDRLERAERERDEARELIAKLRDGVRYLECPCCGEEGAFPTMYEDGDPTICGCGGQVSADGEGAYISIHSEEECPKCSAPSALSGEEPPKP